MAETRDLSKTAGSNNFNPSEGGWPEGTMNYRDVNDAAREDLAIIKRWIDDNNGTLTADLNGDTYEVTPNASLIPRGGVTPSLYEGFTISFRALGTANAPIFLDVAGLGAVKIYDANGNGQLDAGSIIANGIYSFVYTESSPETRFICTGMTPRALIAASINANGTPSVLDVGSRISMEGVLRVGTDDNTLLDTEVEYPVAIADFNNEGDPVTGPHSLAYALAHSGTGVALGAIGYFAGVNLQLRNLIVNAPAGISVNDGGSQHTALNVDTINGIIDLTPTGTPFARTRLTPNQAYFGRSGTGDTRLLGEDALVDGSLTSTVAAPSVFLKAVADLFLQIDGNDVLHADASVVTITTPLGNVEIELDENVDTLTIRVGGLSWVFTATGFDAYVRRGILELTTSASPIVLSDNAIGKRVIVTYGSGGALNAFGRRMFTITPPPGGTLNDEIHLYGVWPVCFVANGTVGGSHATLLRTSSGWVQCVNYSES